MKLYLYIITSFLLFTSFNCGLDPESTSGKEAKLVSWHAGGCDNTTDPDRSVNRITDISVANNQLYITISFKDNCCATFKPTVKFKNNTLFIQPYAKYEGDYCSCDCCFSLNLVISNISDTSFTTLFESKKIVCSQEPYPILPIQYKIVKGDTVNRNNKYGAPVGLWINRYDNDQIKKISLYTDNNTSLESESVWEKEYHQNGRMSSYYREDSTESWYADGKTELQRYIKHVNGDEIEYKTEYHKNGKLKLKSIVRDIGEKNRKVDSLTGATLMMETLVEETYYDNGQPESIIGSGDTAKWWYEDGKLKKWRDGDTSTEFYLNGALKIQERHWQTNGPKGPIGRMQLQHYVTIGYYLNGNMSYTELVRDEEDAQGVAIGVRYVWSWDKNGKLIEKPDNWKGPIPK